MAHREYRDLREGAGCPDRQCRQCPFPGQAQELEAALLCGVGERRGC